MKRTCLVAVVLLMFSHLFAGVCFAGDWKKDFENLCGKTQNAEKMTNEELSQIITECERVKGEAEDSTDPQKKVYLFRIKKCLNFYLFMKESRN